MEDIIPTDFFLSQNHPNPFKDRTTIKYCVPNKERIRLEVFNSSRNKVKTIVKEIKDAGTYKVDIDARNLPEGIYFYQLKAGDFVETKKMVLMK
jgi:hypothetical protein